MLKTEILEKKVLGEINLSNLLDFCVIYRRFMAL